MLVEIVDFVFLGIQMLRAITWVNFILLPTIGPTEGQIMPNFEYYKEEERLSVYFAWGQTMVECEYSVYLRGRDY